ncbi:unnamed protein product [Parascedosporium putredinis]|uniref:Uncharacterized protein n=1 Tax=Parascedosporium putredinis TaxID=1442378 RepID=A0A9P1H6U5_9PEZI|nr:unnamed protein product [Parascedosporium putredinis]CAI7997867.1 unnamed protein product [Parascedosporium putredinis]
MVKGRRISKDPNNHRWVKDETTFGQRILRSWLDARRPPRRGRCASCLLHGAANSSYIRVLLKEDAGGLGYRPGGVSGENDIAGIDEVKDIFARLNGKVETEEEKRERERRKAMVYLGQKIGGITFVRGGFLVQDGLDLIETSSPNPADATQTTGDQTMASIGKRKAEEESSEGSDRDVPRKKRRKDDESRAEKKRRKEEKKRRRDAQTSDGEESAQPATVRSQPGSETDSVSVPTPTPMVVDSSTSGTPTESGTSTPTTLSKGRHIHHARRVAAKRAAMLDAAALKQKSDDTGDRIDEKRSTFQK